MPNDRSRRLVVLTGAGISRESGLHTFRDPDGIWSQVRIEDVATHEAFTRDPERVNDFYNQRRRQLLSSAIRSNAAHVALARLEREWSGDFLLVTQNIDDLHERAGSNKILHMHGELLRAKCSLCGDSFVSRDDLSPRLPCPRCGRTGGLRPDVVWFGEIPHGLEETFARLQRCDLFAAIGTSGNVYPAAQFVMKAATAGAHTIELNLEPSQNKEYFSEQHLGPAGEIVPAWVERLLAQNA